MSAGKEGSEQAPSCLGKDGVPAFGQDEFRLRCSRCISRKNDYEPADSGVVAGMGMTALSGAIVGFLAHGDFAGGGAIIVAAGVGAFIGWVAKGAD